MTEFDAQLPHHPRPAKRAEPRVVTTVVLVEEDPLLREGIASVLTQSGMNVARTAVDAERLLTTVRSNSPDLVVIGIRLPPTGTTEGLDAVRAIRDELPETGILILSAHADIEQAMELLDSDQRIGYLLKNRITDINDFVETAQRIAKGATVVDPALVQELVSARRRNDPLEALSVREHEVLALMAEGRSNSGIARNLCVTEGTVEKHVRSILTKLGLAEHSENHRRVLAVLTFLGERRTY